MIAAATPHVERRFAIALVGLAASVIAVAAGTLVSPLIVLGLPIAVVIALVVLRWPWISVLMLIASVPAQDAGVASSGLPLTMTRACVAVAAFALVATLIVARKPVAWHPASLLISIYLGVMALSAIGAANMGASLAEMARWAIAIFAFMLLVQFLRDGTREQLLALLAVIAAAGAAEALLGIAQSVAAAGPASFRVSSGLSRAFGTFGRPNTFGGYLEMTFFPTLWAALYALSRLRPAITAYRRARLSGMIASATERGILRRALLAAGLFGMATVVIAAGLLFSLSRGAWLGVAAGLLVSLLAYGGRTRVVIVAATPLVALVIAAGATGLLPSVIGSRLTSIVDEARPFDASNAHITNEEFSTIERMAHWQAGWRMFEDYPGLGVGAGNFNERYPDYYVRADFRFSQGHAHNYYIQTLAETGIIGLAAYLAVTGYFIALALRVAVSNADGFTRTLALGGLGTLIAVAVHNVFENLHVLNMGIQIACAWFLVLAAHRRWRLGGPSIRNDVEYSRA